MFKTLEEANLWKIEQEKKYNDLKLAHEGLQSKLNETEKMVQEKVSEIDRLKIKNYEYMEQISVQNDGTSSPDEKQKDDEIDFDDFLKKF